MYKILLKNIALISSVNKKNVSISKVTAPADFIQWMKPHI